MTTVSFETAQRIAASAQPAVDAVHDALQEADYHFRHLTKPSKRMASLTKSTHIKFATDVYRFFMVDYLDNNEMELGDWSLNRSVQKNSITLHNGLQTIKVMHTQRRDIIPTAGRNDQRVNYFCSDIAATDPGALMEAQNLILTWQRFAPLDPMRLVHTLSAGTYSQNPKIDFSCFMQRSDEDFSGYVFDQRGMDELDEISRSVVDDEAVETGS